MYTGVYWKWSDEIRMSPWSGLRYFIEEKAYKNHIKNYVAESDISSCITFAVLLQKDTQLTSGLRCSGVGGCVCAHHGVVRTQGLGDLQKGEWYANMDYIFLSSIIGVTLLFLAVSYDIACQWKINLILRAQKIRETATLPTRLEDFEIVFALPVWHAAAHEIEYQTQYSQSYTEGVGRMDREGIERTWAILNPLGFSTKEMGNGACHDAIEDKVDHVNFEKSVGQGDTLVQKLVVAIVERDRQVAVFTDVNCTLHSHLRKKWQERIDTWLADRSKPNPYCLAGGQEQYLSAGPSEAAVLQELKDAEAREVAKGRDALADLKSTPVAFIKVGLVLEECQRRMKAELKGSTLVTADRTSHIQEQCVSFLKKLRTFEHMQAVFMPGVAALKEAAEDVRNPDTPPPKAEELKLWLLSELAEGMRRTSCKRGVAEMEAKLRHAQCDNALEVLCSRLHAQTHLIIWRNSNSVGQWAATRSNTLIGQVGDRITRVAGKYRHVRAALIELKDANFAPQFKALEQRDLNTNAEEEKDTHARRKLARLGSSKCLHNKPALGPAKKKGSPGDPDDPDEASSMAKCFSWIWTVGGGPGEDTEQLHNSVHVEWSKAKARRDQWVEEVQLLREEMKRVLHMLCWTQQRWVSHVNGWENIDPELRVGIAAYTRRQIYIHWHLVEGFEAGWKGSMAAVVQQVVEQDRHIYCELLEQAEVDGTLVGLMELDTMVVT
ncbi:hypothetical protein K438DRAFT_1747154 [Mycena galopus ATCC 62051]|nr:hypothetical protein K438DRAFT_1747154 [Mycena galopus ATCC 62051]